MILHEWSRASKSCYRHEIVGKGEGYQPRDEYRRALASADLFVSTAGHEFFGIAAVEAISAGAFPLLPNRLSYPELLAGAAEKEDFFYDGTAKDLASHLAELSERLAHGDLWRGDADRARRAVGRFCWSVRAGELDSAIAEA